MVSVVDLYHPDADPDSDFYLDPIFLSDADAADTDPDPSFQIQAQTLEKVLKKGSYRIPYILTCHLNIDADPDSAITLMLIRILNFI